MAQLPLRLSDASGIPYYRQIVDQVRDLIAVGSLAPGTLLPSVRDLAATLLVSLITVRRAYADLEAAGLVKRRQGRGTFVVEKVGAAARNSAQQKGLRLLVEAVDRARMLGLDDDAIVRHVGSIVARPASRARGA